MRDSLVLRTIYLGQATNFFYFRRILVLKDGQIVEQGNHRQLLEQDGVFANMWSDQIRAEEPDLVPLESTKQELIGYFAEPETTAVSRPPVDISQSEHEAVPEAATISQAEDQTAAQEVPASHTSDTEAEGKADVTDRAPADLTVTAAGADTENSAAPSTPPSGPVVFPSDEPVAFPSDAPVAFPNAPISFPTSEQAPESESGLDTSGAPATPGVTFDESVAHPSRSETPDPSAEPKRKRTASQNFQRFARRVSLVGKRPGSGFSAGSGGQSTAADKDEVRPGSAREASTLSDETRGAAEGSATASPAASLAEGKKLPRKEKLKKRFSMGGSKKDGA